MPNPLFVLALDDAVHQVGDLVAFANLHLFETDVVDAEPLKEPHTFAEQHWHHTHMDFIQKASHYELLLDIDTPIRTSLPSTMHSDAMLLLCFLR